MIRKETFYGVQVDENGEHSISFPFNGWLEEINVWYGTLEMDTEIEFVTSSGHSFKVMGNNQLTFPINPRHTPNTSYFSHAGISPSLEKYVNAGIFQIRIRNAGAKTALALLEVIYSE